MSLPCVKGGGSRERDGGIVKNKIISKNNPSVTFGDSSLCTREAYCHPTVHLKGVTHYTLQGKECEKEYEQNARTPFVFTVGKTCFMEGNPKGAFF